MKKVLAVLLAAVLIFAAGFGLSWWLDQPAKPQVASEPTVILSAPAGDGQAVAQGEAPTHSAATQSASPEAGFGGLPTHQVSVTQAQSGYQMLVNADHPLGQSGSAGELVNVYENKPSGVFSLTDSSVVLSRVALDAAVAMFTQAQADGQQGYIITSGYRAYERQQRILDEGVAEAMARGMSAEEARADTLSWVALPGASEHQTGLAMDIQVNGLLSKYDFGKTPQGKWLAQNSWRYGFVVRYPDGKQDITKITNEPWHFRYVGLVHAQIMAERDLCLEEYVDFLRQQGRVQVNCVDGARYAVAYMTPDADGFITAPEGAEVSCVGDGGAIVTWVS